MHSSFPRRFGLCLVFLAAVLGPVLAAPPDEKTQDFKGKVVSLSGVLEKAGAKLDADAAPHWLALQTADGKLYPLVKDDGSRLFFKDEKLLGRPMILTGRLIPGSQLLQVVKVHSVVKGETCEVFYWCDICSIKRFEKKLCDCCGGPMELREEPVANNGGGSPNRH